MKLRFWIVPFCLAAACAPLHAELKLGADATVGFATAEEGAKMLTSRDDYVQGLSPFDRAEKMKTDRDVTEEEFLKFAGANVLGWNDAGKQKVSEAVEGIRAKLDGLGLASLPFPKQVLFIKTTGKEEAGAEYTRANAVALPAAMFTRPEPVLQGVIAHELFHVLSRANPELRDALYAAIGFVKCNDVEFPKELLSRKITNPDAPRNDHCIRLRVAGNPCWAVPILFSSADRYDVQRGGEFFNYLQFQLLLVERDEASSTVKPIYDGPTARLVGVQGVSGFFEQVGRNTQYIIHPEEILAENFRILVMGQEKTPSPQILRKVEEALKRGAGLK